MVDKLEPVLELGAEFTKEAAEIRAEVRSGRESTIPFKKSKYYAAVVDLRPLTGDDALFHIQSRFGNHADKLELLNTGEKKWDQMMTTIAHVYDGNPEDLAVRRVDLCCDLPDITVDRLLRTVRTPYKRIERQFSEIALAVADGDTVPVQQIATHKLTGFQVGMRPNLIRVYDKNAETFVRYQEAKRRHDNEAAAVLSNKVLEIGEVPLDNADVNRGFRRRLKDAACRMYPFASYADWSGLWEWQVLTRVERQFGSDLPLSITTVRALRDNALTFNPFENLQFVAEDMPLDSDLRKFTAIQRCAGKWMMHALRHEGLSMQQLAKELSTGKNGKRSGNGKRLLKKFAPFLRQGTVGDDGAIDISSSELFERYRESIKRQLAA